MSHIGRRCSDNTRRTGRHRGENGRQEIFRVGGQSTIASTSSSPSSAHCLCGNAVGVKVANCTGCDDTRQRVRQLIGAHQIAAVVKGETIILMAVVLLVTMLVLRVDTK